MAGTSLKMTIADRIRNVLSKHSRRWLKRRIPAGHRTTLNRRNIFILPTRQGLGFLLVLGLMLIGAINYEANLAFALVFLLLGVFLLGIFHTFRNLSGLILTGMCEESTFAGENLTIGIVLERNTTRDYEAIQLSFEAEKPITTGLVGRQEARQQLQVTTHKRGWFRPQRMTVETRFPLGLFRAWSLPDMDLRSLVYPQPLACDLDGLLAQYNTRGHQSVHQGQDDFHGLRDYQEGDSLRHVAWKNFARGQGMFTKVYAGNVQDRLWLDWDMFPGMHMENRLSRLCFCVLQLDNRQVDYGLRLPGLEIKPAKGPGHYRKVLKALALFSQEGKP